MKHLLEPHKVFHALRGMPPVLIGLLVGVLCLPLHALSLSLQFWQPSPDSLPKFLFAVTFWVLPLIVAYALVLRHHLLLPSYLVQCALFLGLWLLVDNVPPDVRCASQRWLLASMLYFALLFGNRNLLYPFLTTSPRLWRRSARFEINRRIFVHPGADDWRSPGVLLDASTSGLAVTVPLTEFRTTLKDLARGSTFLVWVKADTGLPEFQLPVELVWKAETKQGEGKLGCRALDPGQMKAYLKAEPSKRPAQVPFHELSDDFALEQDVQQIALMLWVLCIALTISLPRTW